MRSVSDFDQRLTAGVQKLPKPITPVLKSVSYLGEPLVVLLSGLAGFTIAAVYRQTSSQKAFLYCAIAFFLCTILKLALHRNRPHNLDIRTFGIRSYSFPSGHAFGSLIFYGLYSYLDLNNLAGPWDIAICFLIWFLIVLIGLSRVYLKAHYPSDVIGGWLLGGIALGAVIQLAF